MAIERCRRGWLFGRAKMFYLTAEQDASTEGSEVLLQSYEIIHLDVLQRQHKVHSMHNGKA